MTGMKAKGVIFDCDGTLVDSEVLAHEIMIEMIAELGHAFSMDEAMAAFRGRKMAECVALIERHIGRPVPESFVPEQRRRLAVAFRERLRPIDGALQLVRSMTLPFCVASSGPREKIELSLSLTGLRPYFGDRIFSSYEVGVWKPDPGLFLHAAQAMGVKPSECAVVEDSMPGIQAGIAAGMMVYALDSGHDAGPLPPGVQVIRHLLELPHALAAHVS
ncbi:MAG TPA: HAD-IA family hydrolase [Candidatus Kapabacteria bacterium]|nr:HAD-IA family hydrolase [Candidatus Kapabacteria bacterium]